MSHHSSSASSHSLAFPSLDVDGTLAGLASSEAPPMRSNTKKLEAASSLEDSSYELLNDGSIDSDDEGQTESLASTDGHTPDDMSSVADTEESDDESFIFENPEPPSNTIGGSTAPPFGFTSGTDVGTGSLTTTTGDARPQQSMTLDFVESESSPQEEDVSSTYLYQTLQASNAAESDLMKHYGSPEIRITFKQSLSKTYMPPKRPFRILFAGEPTDYMRDETVKKIASALAAGSKSISDSSTSSQQSSSRFSVVRVPSGTGFSTNLQLIDSTDIELVVDQCIGASRHGTGPTSFVALRMSDGNDMTSVACNFDRDSWMGSVPDIAVFFHQDASAYQLSRSLEALGQHQLIRESLESQLIPILDISEVVPFRQCPDSYTYGSKSLRLCVEGRDPGEIEFRVLETLPVNINSFLDINPGQLNRHLACLIQSGSGVLSTTNTNAGVNVTDSSQSKPGLSFAVRDWLSKVEFSGSNEWWGGFKTLATTFWQSRGPLLAASILMLAMFTALLERQTGIYNNIYTSETHKDIVSSSSINSLSASVLPWNQAPVTAGAPRVSSAATHTSTAQASKDISTRGVDKSLGLPFTNSILHKLNESSEFKIHIIGDHHFVLTPPQQFLKLRKPPTLFVRVARAGSPIPSSVSKLNEGVFAVELERQHANGLLNVSIWTQSKPLVSQNFTISFGSPWLKLSAWANSAERLSEVVKSDVALAQTSLRTVSSILGQSIRNGKVTVEQSTSSLLKQTTSWAERAKRGSQTVAEHLQDAKREAAQQVALVSQASKDLSQRIENGVKSSAQVPARLWHATRPVRTSKSVLKARRNSQRLWRKMGLPGLPEDDGASKRSIRKSCKKAGKKSCKKMSRR